MDASQGKHIEWSQPKILLHDDDSSICMSYPDLIGDTGNYYATETHKNVARVHEILKLVLDGLNQWDGRNVATSGWLLKLPAGNQMPGARIITFVLDGILCDGGEQRQFGWGRFGSNLRTPQGATVAKVSPAIQSLRNYGRARRASEAVGNFQAGLAR